MLSLRALVLCTKAIEIVAGTGHELSESHVRILLH